MVPFSRSKATPNLEDLRFRQWGRDLLNFPQVWRAGEPDLPALGAASPRAVGSLNPDVFGSKRNQARKGNWRRRSGLQATSGAPVAQERKGLFWPAKATVPHGGARTFSTGLSRLCSSC